MIFLILVAGALIGVAIALFDGWLDEERARRTAVRDARRLERRRAANARLRSPRVLP